MNNRINDFKLSLKKHAEKKDPEPFTDTLSLLEQLGLTNLPDDISVTLSDDRKYINFKLNSPDSSTQHLTFQLPISEESLNSYFHNPQVEELSNRYELYNTDYKDKIKEYSINERKFLAQRFPNMIFNIKIRIKSKLSYQKKLQECIKSHKSPLIGDIIAERIIISEFNGSNHPKILEKACYEVSQALDEYRKTTDFRMKHSDLSTSTAKTHLPYLTKDYIAHPKENGYQSLHISLVDKENPDCCYETQIRTFQMENQAKKDTLISHAKYKPRLLNEQSILNVPKYTEITSFLDSNGNPLAYEVPTKHAFHHYYGQNMDQYKKELKAIENYVKLHTVRKKLRALQHAKSLKPDVEKGSLCL